MKKRSYAGLVVYEAYARSKHEIYMSKGKPGTSWLLLLDEPDISLHPEWQQKYLSLLLRTLQGLFPEYVFQIIITTHSPILLSDIPKSNTILVEKDDNGHCVVMEASKETFGANIYSLYNDSFFLSGIPIGEFACSKLKDIENQLKGQGDLDKNVVDDIYRIGEPVIKNYFLKLLDERRTSMDNNDRIAYLRRELHEAERNDKN